MMTATDRSVIPCRCWRTPRAHKSIGDSRVPRWCDADYWISPSGAGKQRLYALSGIRLMRLWPLEFRAIAWSTNSTSSGHRGAAAAERINQLGMNAARCIPKSRSNAFRLRGANESLRWFWPGHCCRGEQVRPPGRKALDLSTNRPRWKEERAPF